MVKTATMVVGVVSLLVTVGFVMLYSTSTVHGETLYNDPLHFVQRQFLWLVIALAGAAVASRIPYPAWKRMAVPFAALSLGLLATVFILGVSVKGSARWLRLGPFNLQPSETAKFAVVLLLAWWMARVRRHADDWLRGAVIPLAMLSLFLGLIFVAPDFGTTLLVGAVGFAMLYTARAHAGILALAGSLGFSAFLVAVFHDAHRMRRILAFLNPQQYARDEAFQLLNAIYAFVAGGVRGAGLGESLQKRHYLPEAHTDFIFAIIGEELGYFATSGIVLLFLVFFLYGWRISRAAPDPFGRLLAFGMTLMIALQAAMNIAVVTGCMPTKGIPLPFISFGGSSLVVSLFMTGVLVNIALSSDGRETLGRKKCG